MARSQTRFERIALRAIAALFPKDEYAVIPQVPDATGFDRVRTADALAFSLWPSRGLTIEGIEIKASKGDLKKELKNPAKTEGMARFCHYWTVAARVGVCDADDLPEPWGLITWDEVKGIAYRVKRPKMLAKPSHDMGFICGLARAVHAECWSPSELEEIKSREHQRGYQDGLAAYRTRSDYELDRLKALREKAIAFAEVTGVDLVNEYHDGRAIGEAYKLALQLTAGYRHTLAPIKLMIEAIEKSLGDLTPQVVEPLPSKPRRKKG